MHSRRRLAPAIALALALAACRQADGPMPTPTDDQRNEIGDIARDMVNIVNKDPEAPSDLTGDIVRYSPNEAAAARSQELARALAEALASARLEDETAQRLAHTLWVGLTAKELSARQVEALERDVKDALTSAGVGEERADSVARQLGSVQQEITNNPRRWYQLF